MKRSVLGFALLFACGGRPIVPQAGETSSGEAVDAAGTSSTSSDDEPVGTTFVDPVPGTTMGTGLPESSSTDPVDTEGETDCAFLCPDETGGAFECSVWDQNCPPGEKCMAWANDGGSAWNATRCSPVDPNPDGVGEPCTVEGGGTSGIDSCALGSMCWDIDPETNMGTCFPTCTGSEDFPVCADPSRVCSLSGDAVLTLCLPLCDPLDPDACDEGLGCYPGYEGFTCAPDASGKGGGLFEPCEFINGCDAGLSCVNPDTAGMCGAGVVGCCVPYCDLGAPICPPQTECAPWSTSGYVPPGSKDVGFCVAGEG